MKTFVYSLCEYERPFLEEAVGSRHTLLWSAKKLSADTAPLAAGCEAIAVFTSDDCRGPVLDTLHALGIRFIALRSVGFDHVDLDKAASCGIAVANVPEYSPYAVAEHAVAMLMTLNRKFVQSRVLIKEQDFRLNGLTGFDVHGKTVGVIGTGKIGMAFARIMNGFGTTLLGYDPVVNPEALALGMRYVALNELLQRSDIVSIHCPLNQHTKYRLSKPEFEMMKPGCILINTSRGGIVRTADLADALESGHLGGACLDVYENEKGLFFEDHRGTVLADNLYRRLAKIENVLITGHQAFLTVEALRGIATTTAQNLDCWQRAERSPNELTALPHTPAGA